MSLFTPTRLNILSQLFTNLAAGWFGVVLIIPGVTKLETLDDFLWCQTRIEMSPPSIIKTISIVCHCEKRSDEAISMLNEIATLIPFARNDTNSVLYIFHYLIVRSDVSILAKGDISILV